MKKLAYVGVDYHIKTVTIAVYLADEKQFHDTRHLTNDDKTIKKYMKKLSKLFQIKICYEASSSGYVFQRKMQALGYHCDVIAPSLVPKKAGDKRKNDFRDSQKLAKNYANEELTIVHPPTEQEESVRSLVRLRLSIKESEKRVKQQINSFLLSQGHRWPKSNWTQQHLNWMATLQLSDSNLLLVLQEYLGHLEYLQSRLGYIDQKIKLLAQTELYATSIKKLKAMRGIGTLTAMILIVEITDFRRFPTPRSLMAFLGLIPAEDSSGGNSKEVGLTKTGNHRCRSALIESVRHYIKKPYMSAAMRQKLSQADAHSAVIAKKCMHRLHKRYWTLVMKGKIANKAIAAIAREFAGFIWALMQPAPVVDGQTKA